MYDGKTRLKEDLVAISSWSGDNGGSSCGFILHFIIFCSGERAVLVTFVGPPGEIDAAYVPLEL